MASSPMLLLASLLLFFFFFSSSAAAPKPKAVVLPVRKDAATFQYVTRVGLRTPSVLMKLVVDLGGRFSWVDCDKGYVSSNYRPVSCAAADCSLSMTPFGCGGTCVPSPNPGCNNNSCSVSPENPFISTSTSGELAYDVLSVASTDGSNPGHLVADRSFMFSCGSSTILQGLASGAKGILGLGRNKVGTPSKIAVDLHFRRRFALCLSSSTTSDGVIFFGDSTYKFLPNVDASQGLLYTPLLINPVSTAGMSVKGEKSVEYFIGVKSIKINEKLVPVNTTLLFIDKNGVGGTKISTAVPYSRLQTSIYKALIKAFGDAMAGVPKAAPVAPFRLCFDATKIGSTRVGPAVPAIDLVLQSESVYWRISGANSMVRVSDKVLCLGFIDGGAKPTTSIVIGGHQLEDNLLQFDLATSKLGFSSTLLSRQTTCANFNFTSRS